MEAIQQATQQALHEPVVAQCLQLRGPLLNSLCASKQPNPSLFFSHMIDYLAFGHFKAYEKLWQTCTQRHSTTAQNLFTRLHNNTQGLMQAYQTFETQETISKACLSATAELLALRFDIEDRLFAMMYG